MKSLSSKHLQTHKGIVTIRKASVKDVADSPFDPLGHVKFSVSDAKVSKAFYDKVLGFLGYIKVDESKCGAGWKSKEGFGVWIKEAEYKEPKYKFFAPGIHHFCFKASSRKAVDELYQFLLKENVFIYDSPQAYPEYTRKYYAVFFADPDRIKLEYAYY